MSEKKIDPTLLFKEQVAKLLRSADEFSREGRYDDAILELERVLRLDPKNSYARSFLERVRFMQKRAEQKGQMAAHDIELSLEERMNVISRHLAAAEEYVKLRNYRQALAEIADVYRIDPTNYYARAFSERIEQLMEQEKTQAEHVKKAAVVGKPPVIQERGAIMLYRELLKEVWFDGKVTPEEEQELVHVRELFSIMEDEHQAIEREVKIEAYVEALRIVWRDNVVTDTERTVLQSMREKYAMSPEELAEAESRFEASKRVVRTKGTILVVDPDREALVALSKKLKNRGYLMFMAQRVEDAWQILSTQTPSLVLSEVFFPGQPTDGFAFFQKLREHTVLRHVPFFCMASVDEPKVIRAGLRLGVDLFLTKPIDFETLIAALEGRLKSL
jgi:CheY-like chemotaxis protein